MYKDFKGDITEKINEISNSNNSVSSVNTNELNKGDHFY